MEPPGPVYCERRPFRPALSFLYLTSKAVVSASPGFDSRKWSALSRRPRLYRWGSDNIQELRGGNVLLGGSRSVTRETLSAVAVDAPSTNPSIEKLLWLFFLFTLHEYLCDMRLQSMRDQIVVRHSLISHRNVNLCTF